LKSAVTPVSTDIIALNFSQTLATRELEPLKNEHNESRSPDLDSSFIEEIQYEQTSDSNSEKGE
jgi:hypothetical protein